jgi:hypothetical protein
MKKDVSASTYARFYAALELSRKIPNAGLGNAEQRKAAIKAWALELKRALREKSEC